MAVPSDGRQKLFVMQPSMSSPFFIAHSEEFEDENAKKMYYKFSSGDRKKIQAIRQEINVVIGAGCASFYGLKIANELSKEQITEALKIADAKMRAVEPTLHADAQFLPLQSEAFASGTLLDNLTAQIREQIHGRVLARIEKTITDNENAGMLSNKTKTALLKMLDKCKAVNVIGDSSIDQRIESMKSQINNNEILAMRDEILTILNESQDRFSSIDMFNLKKTGGENEPAKANTEPLTKNEQAALDEDKKYDARVAEPDPEPDERHKARKKRVDQRFAFL
jgi:hypothetical protein